MKGFKMEHYNLSEDWRIGVTYDGQKVLTPVDLRYRNYVPKYDICINNQEYKLETIKRSYLEWEYDPSLENKGRYVERETFECLPSGLG